LGTPARKFSYAILCGYDVKIPARDAESFCPGFELSSCVPEEVINEATQNDRLHYVDVGVKNMCTILEEVSRYLEGSNTVATRICIPRLGTAGWGDLTPQVGCMTHVKKSAQFSFCIRVYYTSCIHYGVFCADMGMDVLLSALEQIFRQIDGVDLGGLRKLDGRQMERSLFPHLQVGNNGKAQKGNEAAY